MSTPEPGSMEDIFGPVISTYTRAQAIQDGALVEVTVEASRYGWRVPVAITIGLWGHVTAGLTWVTEEGGGQVMEGAQLRVRQLVDRAAVESLGRKFGDLVEFEFTNAQGRCEKVWLKGAPGDSGEPVVTIMLPEDD